MSATDHEADQTTNGSNGNGQSGNGHVDRMQSSLATAAARNLATTTKTVPQMHGITSRWLLRLLPWLEVKGGTYRVNRRLSYAVGDGRVTFTSTGADIRVIPRELCELPSLRGFEDEDVLGALADRFEQREFEAGDVIVESGAPVDEVYLLAHGKVNKLGTGEYGDQTVLDTLADGDYFGDRLLTGASDTWTFTVKALTPCHILSLSRQAFSELADNAESLRAHIEQAGQGPSRPQDEDGEAAIELSAGHEGEVDLPSTFVDYEGSPREYELSVAQTVLRVHSRVADLYNDPMNQIQQQLRLTVEALRERQEDELINNRDFGLLHNVALEQRRHARTGAPTPDELDELLALVWKEPTFFLAHPRTIAAFGRECSRAGIYPQGIEVGGHRIPAWRGVPIYPCNKLRVTETNTSSILLMRVGQESQGVVGLRQTGLPDEYEPGLNVRFMGITEQAIISYLVSTYFSAAVLVSDALGILENVELGREG